MCYWQFVAVSRCSILTPAGPSDGQLGEARCSLARISVYFYKTNFETFFILNPSWNKEERKDFPFVHPGTRFSFFKGFIISFIMAHFLH